MKILALLTLGVTLYATSGQKTSSDRRPKQMSFGGFWNQYAVPSYLNFLPKYYGAKYGVRPDNEQLLRGSNANQEGQVGLLTKNQQLITDDPSARLFLSGNVGIAAPSITNNFLIKTSYVFTTATGTVCKLTTCIPASLFSSIAAGANPATAYSTVICRRKRREVLEILGETIPIQPSKPTMTVTTILDPDFKPVPEERKMEMSPYPVLESSLDDPSDPEKTRTKRFAFILTTTLTSYSLTSATYTITIKPAGDSSLTCRPSAYGICGV